MQLSYSYYIYIQFIQTKGEKQKILKVSVSACKKGKYRICLETDLSPHCLSDHGFITKPGPRCTSGQNSCVGLKPFAADLQHTASWLISADSESIGTMQHSQTVWTQQGEFLISVWEDLIHNTTPTSVVDLPFIMTGLLSQLQMKTGNLNRHLPGQMCVLFIL